MNLIFKGYSQSEDFLAEKLLKVFTPIENEKDRALHNDMLDDISAMVGREKLGLCRKIARIIIRREYKTGIRKNFVLAVARAIIDLGAKRDGEKTTIQST